MRMHVRSLPVQLVCAVTHVFYPLSLSLSLLKICPGRTRPDEADCGHLLAVWE